MTIRPETEHDYPAVYAINAEAFDIQAEAALVDRLRESAGPYVSLVAEDQDQIVGHILFTRVDLDGHPAASIFGLAPMAVKATHRNQGIGGRLIEAGFKACADLGVGAVVVLGHPGYYPKFGFKPAASTFTITSEYGVPDEVFMAIELTPDYLTAKNGLAKYHKDFASV